MDFSHWMALESAMQGEQPRGAFRRATLRRVAAFARPHRRALVAFLLLSVVAAVLTVLTPVLAGEGVDEIAGGGDPGTGLSLAGVIALLSVLCRAAQRAFTWTLSGVVSNAIALLLTLGVMLRLSWMITGLALLLLPVFLLPARRMGSRLASLEREAAGHNAAMTTQMTERFSAPGATLVKLFGRPDREEAAFGARAERVAEIGVRTALGHHVFLTALAGVSALALALVYGLGGWLALRGDLAPGPVVTLALLLTRLYSPLTALANARVDVMTALVAFERVFEVLDVRPMITERPDARTVPAGEVSVEFDNVRFSYPSADQVSLASLEEVAILDSRGGTEVLHGVDFRAEPGQLVALVGSSGAGKSTIASLVPRLYDVGTGAG